MIHTVSRRRSERWQPARLAAAIERLPAPKPWMITHVFPVVVAILVSLRWYEPGSFVAAGDVSPLLRDSVAGELTSLWNHQISGGGSTSTEIVRLPEVLLIAVVRFFGGSQILAQQMLFSGAFGLSALGSSHLARVLVRSRGAIAVAGLIGAFNPFHLVQLPNPLFMVAVGTVGLVLGELLGHLAGRKTTALRLVLASAPYAYLASNPALLAANLVSFVGALALASRFVDRDRMMSLGRVVLKTTPWMIALHLWWIVPSVYVLGLGLDGADVGVVTDVEIWSWSHAENSIANLVTLSAHWGWSVPDIFPWASSLDRFPGSLTRWVLPLGVFMAPFVAPVRVRKTAWTLLAVIGVVILLSKGLHAPAAGLNRALYQYVPGFWLLREPVSKLGPFQVLLYSTMFAITIERLVNMAPMSAAQIMRPSDRALHRRSSRREVPIGQLGAALLVVAAVSFPWPLLTGDVMADDRGALQSIHTEIPDDWYEITEAINSSPTTGKVLVLPANEFYQVTTTWGYHGADAVPQQLLDRPMIQRYPGGYFSLSAGFGGILERIEYELLDGSPEQAAALMDSLGVSHVIHRFDVVSGAVNAQLADNDLLASGLGLTPGLQQTMVRDVAVVYELGDPGALIETNGRTLVTRGDVNDVAEQVGRLVPGEVIVADAAEADALVWMSESNADVFPFELDDLARYEVRSAPGPRTIFASAEPTGEQGQWTLQLDDRSTIALDDDVLPGAASRTEVLPGEPLALEVDGRLDIFEQDLGLTFDLSDPVTVFTAASETQLNGFTTLGDCNNRAPQVNETLVLSAVRTGPGSVELGANDHSACVSVDLPNTEGPGLVEFAFRTGSEDSGRFCVWDVTAQSCSIDERLERSTEWQQVRGAIDFHGDHRYQLFLYALTDDGEPVRVEYSGLQFLPLTGSDLFMTPEESTEIELGAGAHLITAEQPKPASLIGPFGDLADCNRFDDRTTAEAGLTLRKSATAVTLGATTHSACTWAELDVVSNRLYEVSFDYRTVTGSPPRVCVWMVGLGRCAELPGLSISSEWQNYTSEFELPTNAIGADLYIYGDGGEDPDSTLVDFRDIAVIPSPRRFIQIEKIDPTVRSSPVVAWTRESPGEYNLAIRGADGPFVLSFAESHATSWTFDALPDGWSARHVESNGYGNSWIMDGSGEADFVLGFGPNAWATRAQNLSLLALLLGLVVLGWQLSDAGRNRRARVLSAGLDSESSIQPHPHHGRPQQPRRVRARRLLTSLGGEPGNAR